MSRVAIVGDDPISTLVAASLAAQGVGTILFVGPSPDGRRLSLGRMGRDGAVGFIARLNPGGVVARHATPLLHVAHTAALPRVDVIVAIGGDAHTQGLLLEHGLTRAVPVILAGARGTTFGFRVATLFDAMPGWAAPAGYGPATPPTQQLVAALVANEVRRLVLPLDDDRPVGRWLAGDLNALPATRIGEGPQASELDAASDDVVCRQRPSGIVARRRVLVAGAGGLGTWLALCLALDGVTELTIVDPDIVEDTNLNRQVLFYEGTGQPKATLLAERLAKLTGVTARGLVSTVEEAAPASTVDLVCAAVDTFRTRAWLNAWCRERAIPLVTGGTSALAGSAHTWMPGRSSCLECSMRISELAAEETGADRCGQAPEPSHVVPNQAVGALMAREVRRIVEARATGGDDSFGAATFDALEPRRVASAPSRWACDCRKHGR